MLARCRRATFVGAMGLDHGGCRVARAQHRRPCSNMISTPHLRVRIARGCELRLPAGIDRKLPRRRALSRRHPARAAHRRRPRAFPSFSCVNAPWIDPARMARDGFVALVPAGGRGLPRPGARHRRRQAARARGNHGACPYRLRPLRRATAVHDPARAADEMRLVDALISNVGQMPASDLELIPPCDIEEL